MWPRYLVYDDVEITVSTIGHFFQWMWTGLHELISVHVFTDKTSPKNSKLQNSNKNRCLIPAGGLPPVILPTGVKGGRVSIINVSAGPETVGPNRYLWSQFFQTCNHHSTCYQ